jgi:hypothetical protein
LTQQRKGSREREKKTVIEVIFLNTS